MFVYDNDITYSLSDDLEGPGKYFKIYEDDDSDYDIKASDKVRLYFQTDCVEVFYFSEEQRDFIDDETKIFCELPLIIVSTYMTAQRILNDLGYERYAKKSAIIHMTCRYSDDIRYLYTNQLYLGEYTREIWTKKADIKPFRFNKSDMCECPLD